MKRGLAAAGRDLARIPSWLLVVLVTVFGTIATAFISLVVEDWTTLDASASGLIGGTSALRLWSALGSVLGLVLFLWVLSQKRRLLGTLYYVRLLDSGVEDRHYDRALEKAAKYGDFMSVSRRRSLDGDVVDLVRVVQDVSGALEDATNSDQSATGFTIAPNLYMPAALAVGYDWLAPNNSRVAEINPPEAAPEFEIELKDCLKAYRAAGSARPADLHIVAGDAERLPERPIVWVHALLTNATEDIEGLNLPGGFGVADLHLVVGSLNGISSAPVDMAGPGVAAATAGTLAAALRWVAGAYPTGILVLSGRLSKAVAFATGRTLGATLRNTMPKPQRYLWRRLVILHVFDPQDPVARPVLVNDEQPDPLVALGVHP